MYLSFVFIQYSLSQVLYYSSLIFVAAGITQENAMYATLSTGGVMVLMTIVSVSNLTIVGTIC